MQCNYNSFIQITNFHGLFRNALRCQNTGACRILVPLRYTCFCHKVMLQAILRLFVGLCCVKLLILLVSMTSYQSKIFTLLSGSLQNFLVVWFEYFL